MKTYNCPVGLSFDFTDIDDGIKKRAGTYWLFTLKLIDSKKREEIIGVAEDEITEELCSKILRMRGGVNVIIEQVISEELLNLPFSQIQLKVYDMGKRIIEIYNERNGASITGFEIISCTLGNITTEL